MYSQPLEPHRVEGTSAKAGKMVPRTVQIEKAARFIGQPPLKAKIARLRKESNYGDSFASNQCNLVHCASGAASQVQFDSTKLSRRHFSRGSCFANSLWATGGEGRGDRGCVLSDAQVTLLGIGRERYGLPASFASQVVNPQLVMVGMNLVHS